jgi:hypothetical protein
MRTIRILISVACCLLVSSIGLAQESEPSSEATQSENASVLSVGLKGGVGLPQVSSTLETTFYVHLEGTYQFPFWGSRLGLITSLGYSQPTASGSGEDASLPGGEYTWEATQKQLTWDLGLMLKFLEHSSDWNIAAIIGSRLMFVSTLTDGKADDQVFGEHNETATIPGAFIGFQAEYKLGPGVLFGEVTFGSSFQELRTTGVLSVSAIGILAGYRFTFAL